MKHFRKAYYGILVCIAITCIIVFVADQSMKRTVDSANAIVTNKCNTSSYQTVVYTDVGIPLNEIKIPPVYSKHIGTLLETLLNANNLKSSCAKIPRRIHQTWTDEHRIPSVYKSTILKWIQHHGDWEYWFWTDALAEQLVKGRFPKYASLYANYSQPINRADAMRYFILHEFGGVYADLDVVALRPLDPLTEVHTFVIPEENAVHTYALFDLNRIPLNALMMSTAGHPFLKTIIEQLPEFKDLDDVIWKTGSLMVDSVMTSYQSRFPTRVNNASLCESVYLASWSQFNPIYDITAANVVRKNCQHRGSFDKGAICNTLKAIRFKQLSIHPSAFSKHLYHHIYTDKGRKLTEKVFNINDLGIRRVNIAEHL
ncbi:uncharacterized protein LOC141913367 [Tubulanus polymorphus]|uniref:uncharacterized protein LOC141913367 n=1 Tax=Tubulanus polymorphus TaxID=672921 RepID=UPI003DA2009C